MNETGLRLFGVVTTLLAYALALRVRRRVVWMHPLVLTCGLLMAMLLILPHAGLRLTVRDYEIGGGYITFFLGPATVALAVPLYKHRATLRRHLVQIGVTQIGGCVSGILSAGAMAMAFHGTREIVLSVLSKCATTPISMEVTRALGGKPEIAAGLTVCSGLLGAVVGPALLRGIGLRKNAAIGLAVGTCAHGIGTSSLIRVSEMQGTYSALALALNGILTAAILTPLAPLIQRLL